MPLRFHHRTEPQQLDTGITADEEWPPRVALFPGAYNPPTIAHEAIAKAALGWANEVIWVIPETFPHKRMEHTSLEQRLEMLCRIAEPQLGFSVATSSGGLYADIGNEARRFYGANADIAILCGRDAAHRVANWEYDEPNAFAKMLGSFRLLVASRHGEFDAGEHRGDRVMTLEMPANFDEVSSSAVRERLLRGEEWRSLVPGFDRRRCGGALCEWRLYCHPPPRARYRLTTDTISSRRSRARFNSPVKRLRSASSTCR